MKASVLHADRGEISLPIGTDTLKVGYRAGQYTTPYLETLADKSIDDVLVDLVSDWNLTDDAEKLIPVTPETIAVLPIRVKRAVWRSIREDLLPNAPSASD